MIHRAAAGRRERLGPLLRLCPVAPSPLKPLPIPGLTLHHRPDCGAHPHGNPDLAHHPQCERPGQ